MLPILLLSGCFPYGIPWPFEGRPEEWQAPPTTASTALLALDGGDLFYVDPTGGSLVRAGTDEWGVIETSRLDLPGEPTRLAFADGDLYVTERATGVVTRVVQRGDEARAKESVEVGSEPYGIAATSDGERLYVAVSLSSEVVALDVRTLDVVGRWTVPDDPRWIAVAPGDRYVYVASAYEGRLTVIDTAEDRVDRVPLPEIERAEGPMTPRLTGDPAVSPSGDALALPALYVDLDLLDEPSNNVNNYYGSRAAVARFTGGVVFVPLDEDGAPADPEGGATFGAIGSYPTAAIWIDDHIVAATEEASDQIVFVDRADAVGAGMLATDDGGLGMEIYSGPTSLVLQGDTLRVRAWLSGAIWSISTADGGPREWRGTLDFDGLTVDGRDQGTRLFYAAGDGTMGRVGSTASCSTCHFERRNDGLTWLTEDGPRQTPSLAGAIAETAPYTWTEDVATIEDEIHATTTTRMGGEGPDQTDVALVANFVRATRAVVLPAQDDGAVERGALVFAVSGCTTCHTPPAFTDGEKHAVLDDAEVNTPTLVGVAATAPYFHDGSAQSLEDVVEAVREGRMGDAIDLSDDEVVDLIAFLRSL